jgi:hypothetical protein
MTRIITRVASASRSDKQGLPAHASQQLRHELREQLKDSSLPFALPPSLGTTKGTGAQLTSTHQHSSLDGWWSEVEEFFIEFLSPN